MERDTLENVIKKMWVKWHILYLNTFAIRYSIFFFFQTRWAYKSGE